MMLEGPLKKTLGILATIKNDAAIDVLWLGLNSPDPAIQEGALRALAKRRHAASHHRLIEMWTTMPPAWHEVIAERPDYLFGAIRSMIVGTDKDAFSAACKVLQYFKEYDLLPALITAAEDSANENADLAAKTVLDLSRSLFKELSSRRPKRRRRDPSIVQRNIIASIDHSVQRFNKHKRTEILEAFLTIAPSDNATLKRILHDPFSKSFLPIIDLLTHSEQPGIIHQALGFLNDAKTPASAVNIIANRSDLAFLKSVMRKIGLEPSKAAKSTLARIEHVPWIHEALSLIDALDPEEQYAAVQFAMATKIHQDDKYRLIRYMLDYGRPIGRRAAAKALAEFNGSEPNRLAAHSSNDKDPQVQALCLAQLRRRGVAGSMVLLIDKLESPHEIVRNAVRESLKEFRIDRYLSTFYTLEDDARESTGQLVYRVDPTCCAKLAKDMESPARSCRLRAVEAAHAMQCAPRLEKSILLLIEDEDHLVRAAAAEALERCPSEATRRALRHALIDNSNTVQEAAERSLQILIASAQAETPPSDPIPTPDLSSSFSDNRSPSEGKA